MYHLLLFIHVLPANQPTVTVVALRHKKFGYPCVIPIQLLYSSSVRDIVISNWKVSVFRMMVLSTWKFVA